jgi:hypothetical protein
MEGTRMRRFKMNGTEKDGIRMGWPGLLPPRRRGSERWNLKSLTKKDEAQNDATRNGGTKKDGTKKGRTRKDGTKMRGQRKTGPKMMA